jgi:hypothetical protein
MSPLALLLDARHDSAAGEFDAVSYTAAPMMEGQCMTGEPLHMLMPDGSLHFGALPQTVLWDVMHARVEKLS